MFVNIIATPVIAPPPCVYSVIDSTKDPVVSRVVLHAAAPLPQHIEFPSLKDDLAKGYVNRRALFVWRFVRIGEVDRELGTREVRPLRGRTVATTLNCRLFVAVRRKQNETH